MCFEMGRLVRDFEHFAFLRLKTTRTCEKCVPVQSGVVGVSAAKVLSVIVGVCVAIGRIETIATAPSQKREPLPVELIEDRRKV
jgi:hypothetical protein